MPRGAFITVEGGEGVGKSSSIDTIQALLVGREIEVTTTREPGGTALGEAVRSWILDGSHGDLSAETEALLMFAARAEHLKQLIRPAMESGTWIVCDRFTDATLAYQGGGRGARLEFLRQLADEIQGEITPDLTILLDAPVEVGFARIADRAHDHFERESGAFFERVRRTYLDLAAEDPTRMHVIDASASQTEVLSSIERVVGAFCADFASRTQASR